jgi:hypothetical protein
VDGVADLLTFLRRYHEDAVHAAGAEISAAGASSSSSTGGALCRCFWALSFNALLSHAQHHISCAFSGAQLAIAPI